MGVSTPTIADVRAAADRIAPLAVETPLIASPALDARAGGRVLLKLENLQRVGAFKFRGAYNCISQVDRVAFPGGVVACSSGNHAQGVAAAATLLGLASRIVMPLDAPAMKVARTRAFGGVVVPYDRASEDREAIAKAIAREHRAAFVHPYDDPLVIAGQGTVGLEIVRQAAAMGVRLDAVLVPCSGGGLATGTALAVKESLPTCDVVTVEPEGFDDFARSLAAGRRLSNSAATGSIADALMAAQPGQITFELATRLLARGVAVSDREIADAVRFAFAELKQVVEPGGAAALAAILGGRYALEGGTVAVVISGGNIDAAELCRLLAES